MFGDRCQGDWEGTLIVSVIIVTYNRVEALKRSIMSVLSQSYEDYELIIVDDSSTDNTESMVKELQDSRIRYIKLDKNSGGSYAPRQMGQKMSTGKYIAVLDDDDFWTDNDKLQLQVAYLEEHQDCVLVGTNAIGMNIDGKVDFYVKYPQDDRSIRTKMLIRNLFYHSSVIYKKEAYLSCGGYQFLDNGHYGNYANEYDLWLKMGIAGGLANLPIYGVGHISIVRVLGVKTRMAFMLQHLKDIRRYKAHYPNYLRAFVISVVFAVIEVPLLVRLKRLIYRKKI